MGTPGLFVEEQHSPRQEMVESPGPIKEDDEISLTSTIASQHDSDEEWAVETIHYEGVDKGQPYYLVEWTGFPIEEATWEPKANVLGELLEEWEVKKQKIALGDEKPFDIKAYQAIVDKRAKERRERHRRRNRERKKRGLELTTWEDESEEDCYQSDEDVSQDDFNAVFPPPKPTLRQKDGEDYVDNREKPPLKQLPEAKEKPESSRKRISAEETPKLPIKRKSSTLLQQNRPQQTSTVPKATGYQGTARKPAATQAPSTSATIHVASPPSTVSSQSIRKAKKTQVGSRKMIKSSQSNVFVGGKPIRQYSRLAENMVDTSKDPRMFANHRIRRKAELQGRDRADQAPANVPTTLFNISRGPPPAPGTSSATTVPRSALKRSIDDLPTNAASDSSFTTSERADATSDQQPSARPATKKRKSVQWADGVSFVDEPESMEVDGQPSGRPKRLKSPEPAEALKRQPPARKLSIAQYQQRSVGQNVDKRIQLGPAKTKDILVTFESVRNEIDKWHLSFTEQELLRFTRTCNASTFSHQRNSVLDRVLSQGNIRPMSPGDEVVINNAAERLKLGSFGAACFHDDFTILIYPSACEDWKTAGIDADAASPANGVLKYVIYKPKSVAANPLPERKTNTSKLADPRASVLQGLLRLDYHRLTPPGLRDVRHNFYLAFPPSREAMLDTVGEWLHAQNPHCRVFSTKTSGDWTAFTSSNVVTHGVVIVHEATTDSLRQFPNVLKLIMNSQVYMFWCIGESLQQRPMYPSIRSIHHGTEPGTFELTRLFPHGSAVLVTPSFLIAEPHHALRLFEWYSKTWHKPTNNTKIVAAFNLGKFLRDLALDCADQRKGLLAHGNDKQLSDSAREEMALKAKLSQQDCAERFETWTIVDGLRQLGLDSLVPDEQLQPIIFAEECIDANDEQSLVNWFGCWSQTRLDQFRKFHVIGTEIGTEARHVIKYEDLPMYEPGTERDPAVEMQPETEAPKAYMQPRRPVEQALGAGSKILLTPSFHNIKSFLLPLSKEMGRPFEQHGRIVSSVAKLFGYPVAYCEDVEKTADAMGDFHRDFATYKKWLQFPWPFFAKSVPEYLPDGIPEKSPRLFNTYIAFFYTPHGYISSENKYQGRHPWIAVYRPTLPHSRPWRATELLIWDLSADEQFPTGIVQASQLIPAQKQLIQYVMEHGEVKNPNLRLERVWYGGFQTPPVESPIDATLAFLKTMSNDVSFYLPSKDIHLMERGYRQVSLGNESHTPAEPVDAMELDLAEDVHTAEGDLASKVIFHPPRSPKPLRSSRCENILYKWVKDVARRDPTRTAFSYTFKPTLAWYRTQKAENRHFEHINVATYQRIFEALRVTGYERPPNSEREKQRKP
ncbi:chromo domain-containing protein [Colletotrichum plurivorum]|uniref:Chromo domain-containing protein n=1 Tax=Colletotrichum plurivorum TaxID=2175906 RepID=A0A8H6KIV2_9PEZI|nr:chromo domain-containing protein [Colletotrichum plurivorum]